jgi:hypothetical protein
MGIKYIINNNDNTITNQFVNGGLSATSISADTYYNLPSFTGNTSGDCITDLWVSNIYGCPPITIHDSVQSVGSQSTGITSFAFGNGVSAFGNYSHAEGEGTIASGNISHAEGSFTHSIGLWSHSEGENTFASGTSSHAEGSATLSYGFSSHAEGESTRSIGAASHAEGIGSISNGEGSHAEGFYSTTGWRAFQTSSVSNGLITISGLGNITSEFPLSTQIILGDGYSSNLYSISAVTYSDPNVLIQLNDSTINNGSYVSSFPGNGSETTTHPSSVFVSDSGYVGHAEGRWTYALSVYSHSEGVETNALGTSSHAEGGGSRSVGDISHSEGSNTISLGQASHSEGESTKSIGYASHSEGFGTIALGDYQHVSGKFNLTATTEGSFIVGNGDDDLNRRNLLFVGGTGSNGIVNVSGKTITTNLQVTSGASTTGYVLTDSDGTGNVTWSPVSGLTGSVKKYSETLTSPSGGTYTITHSLGTTDIQVSLWLVTTGDLTNARVTNRQTNSVNVVFSTSPGEDVRVVILG